MVNDPVLFESVLTHQSTRRGAACAAACAVALARALLVACAAAAIAVAGPTVGSGLAYGGLLRKVPGAAPWRAVGGRNAGVLLTVAPTPARGALSRARTNAATAMSASAAKRRATRRARSRVLRWDGPMRCHPFLVTVPFTHERSTQAAIVT